MTEIKQSTHAVIKLEFPVNATVERLWEALTKETSSWWDKDFVSLPGSPGVKLEPYIGGRLYEETDDGRGLIWATVIYIHEGKSIDFVGYMTPEWCGPTMTFLKLAVEERDGGSVLKVTDGLLGNVYDEQLQSMHEGWTFLFDTKLKGYLEGAVGAVNA